MLKEKLEMVKQIESMIAKAEASQKSEDALRFSQAALNAANAMVALVLHAPD